MAGLPLPPGPGGFSPPSGPPPLMIPPEQLDLLQKRGLVSPDVATAAKARMLDARLGLQPGQGQGFQQMLGAAGQPAGGAQPGVAPPVAPVPRPQIDRKRARQNAEKVKIWQSLAAKVKTAVGAGDPNFAKPLDDPNAVGVGEIPGEASNILRQLVDGTATYWDMRDLDVKEKAMLAQLRGLGQQEKRQKAEMLLRQQQSQMQAPAAPGAPMQPPTAPIAGAQ